MAAGACGVMPDAQWWHGMLQAGCCGSVQPAETSLEDREAGPQTRVLLGAALLDAKVQIDAMLRAGIQVRAVAFHIPRKGKQAGIFLQVPNCTGLQLGFWPLLSKPYW